MMIDLRQITWDNYRECIDLKVANGQENFIEDNTFSLAQSYVAIFNDSLAPLTYAVYHNDLMIGFTMIYYHTLDDRIYHDLLPYA
jgi:diamine N-acetyltransferase